MLHGPSSSVFSQESQMLLFFFPGLSYRAAGTPASAHRGFWVDDRLLRSAHCLPDFTGNTRGTGYFHSILNMLDTGLSPHSCISQCF